jgi:uncharacterized OsmC-like protein
MSTLNEYLEQKREAFQKRQAKVKAGEAQPQRYEAKVRAEGRSGVRRIRIRDFQVVSDSPPDFAGYDLGPGSPELQLGVLGSCLTHIFLIHAADRKIPLESLEVEVSGQLDPRGGQPGYEHIPVYPHDIRYVVHVESSATSEELRDLYEAVEKVCPILNLLANPQTITGRLEHKNRSLVEA